MRVHVFKIVSAISFHRFPKAVIIHFTWHVIMCVSCGSMMSTRTALKKTKHPGKSLLNNQSFLSGDIQHLMYGTGKRRDRLRLSYFGTEIFCLSFNLFYVIQFGIVLSTVSSFYFLSCLNSPQLYQTDSPESSTFVLLIDVPCRKLNGNQVKFILYMYFIKV